MVLYIIHTTCVGYITRIRPRHHLHLTFSTSHSLTNKEVHVHVKERETHAVNDMIGSDNAGGRLVMSCFPQARILSHFYFGKNEITSANG